VWKQRADADGDTDIGGRTTQILTGAGFDIVTLLPIWRVSNPGSPLWDWLSATNKNHTNLVAAGLITASDLEAYYREWDEYSTMPNAFFTVPPLLATIARYRG
jgi:hypothetical protein